MNGQVNVVIIMWQGLIEDVAGFKDEADAFRFFQKETSVSYEEFKKRSETEDSENILADYAGSNIWEADVK